MKNLIKREQSKPVCFAESENSRTKFKRFIVSLMAMLGVLILTHNWELVKICYTSFMAQRELIERAIRKY